MTGRRSLVAMCAGATFALGLWGGCKKPPPPKPPGEVPDAGRVATEHVTVWSAYEKPILDGLLRGYLQAQAGAEVRTSQLGEDVIEARLKEPGARPDIVLGLPREHLARLAKLGALAPTAPLTCKDIQAADRDPGGQWIGLSVSGVALGVNETMLRSKQKPLPRSWKELGSAPYRGWVVVARPRVSRAVRVLVSSLVAQLHPRGWKVWGSIDKNLFQYTPGELDPARLVASGESIYAVDFEKHFYAQKRAGKPVAILYPNPTYFELEGMALVQGAKNGAGGARFAEWLCTEPALRAIDVLRAGVTKPFFENPTPGKLRLTQIKPTAVGDAMDREAFFEEWERRFGK